MNLYISDLHFGHKNIMLHDHRPFSSVEEMDETLIYLWNNRVQANDDVWILGDFCFRNGKDPVYYLSQLKGQKHLIVGNHDTKLLKNDRAKKYFVSIDYYKEINDNEKRIILFHYPIAEWNGYFRDSWLIYGHIHGNKDASYEFMKTQDYALNAAACINNYTPVSFRELVENNRNFQLED
jgi:calcineurin-like phosphoesterase family protein